jgi:integrase
LFRAAEKADLDLAVFLVLAAVTGARRGELCAVRWSDLDLDEGTVTISRVITLGPDGPVERNKPKTRGSVRTLSLDSGTVTVLRAHRARCAERARACGAILPAKAFLFSNDPNGAEAWRPDSTSRRFRTLRDRVGLDEEIHLHGLRHFVVTTLLGAGVELPQVAGRVGHGGGGKTTLAVYSHFQARREREVAELLGRMLRDPSRSDSRLGPRRGGCGGDVELELGDRLAPRVRRTGGGRAPASAKGRSARLGRRSGCRPTAPCTPSVESRLGRSPGRLPGR